MIRSASANQPKMLIPPQSAMSTPTVDRGVLIDVVGAYASPILEIGVGVSDHDRQADGEDHLCEERVEPECFDHRKEGTVGTPYRDR